MKIIKRLIFILLFILYGLIWIPMLIINAIYWIITGKEDMYIWWMEDVPTVMLDPFLNF